MPQFERRFIELCSHSVFQIEGSEPGSQRAKKLAVKTRLQIRYPQNSLDAQNTQTLDKKNQKIRQQVIQHYPSIRKQLATLKGNLIHRQFTEFSFSGVQRLCCYLEDTVIAISYLPSFKSPYVNGQLSFLRLMKVIWGSVCQGIPYFTR